jgi:hypothetical protein
MGKPYSIDLRERVVAAVKTGGMSCNRAAKQFGVGIAEQGLDLGRDKRWKSLRFFAYANTSFVNAAAVHGAAQVNSELGMRCSGIAGGHRATDYRSAHHETASPSRLA